MEKDKKKIGEGVGFERIRRITGSFCVVPSI